MTHADFMTIADSPTLPASASPASWPVLFVAQHNRVASLHQAIGELSALEAKHVANGTVGTEISEWTLGGLRDRIRFDVRYVLAGRLHVIEDMVLNPCMNAAA